MALKSHRGEEPILDLKWCTLNTSMGEKAVDGAIPNSFMKC